MENFLAQLPLLYLNQFVDPVHGGSRSSFDDSTLLSRSFSTTSFFHFHMTKLSSLRIRICSSWSVASPVVRSTLNILYSDTPCATSSSLDSPVAMGNSVNH